ncbi:TonB family protein [Pyxidicoccus xibeiensis]|uniref:TonB family protein n=1 Tax=Pyxidicoccus xibeiensis TaxID=2906759 RepID=UPI0020A70845|nr:TonB family protein [Pyxidicoccus xibeiensis]MCP3144854.1 TonB family protein [Pyxidicoccus xibeiensis]
MPLPEPASLADIILRAGGPKKSGGAAWAVLATVALHGAAGAFAWRAWKDNARPDVVTAPKRTLQIDHVVELPPPPAPAPAPAPKEPPRAARSETVPSRPRASRPSNRESPPPAPAQAAEVVAAKEAEPLDFTGFDIATGNAPRYAGGVTASKGTSTQAVHGPADVAGEAEGEGTSRARPVQLPARNWSCPWPREADALRVDEQTVVLRVVVDTGGRVTSSELVSDPGHGFGAAALECARNARFDPALDRGGQPYVATSPPIRVRFKRR